MKNLSIQNAVAQNNALQDLKVEFKMILWLARISFKTYELFKRFLEMYLFD